MSPSEEADMQERITLSQHEAQRMQVLEQVERGTLTLKAAAPIMKVCYRQAKRILVRYREEGLKGLTHRRRGRPASNTLGPEVRRQVLALHEDKYQKFNDCHFVEMLVKREGLRIGRETVRRWLREAGLRPKRQRRAPKHRSRRPRRPQMGLMMQWDGSPHRWFGPSRPPCSLLHSTDDATGTVLGALLRPQEDAVGYLRLLDMVARRHGLPASVYQDRHSALFRNDDHWSHEEELAGVRFPTHVGRVLQELAIEAIPAYSAQAKGRIERQGGTLQDRLIAEMALEGITDIEQAEGEFGVFAAPDRRGGSAAPSFQTLTRKPRVGQTKRRASIRVYCFYALIMIFGG
jgi:transposase